MTPQEAEALRERINAELPEGFSAYAAYRLNTPNNWHVMVRHYLSVGGRVPPTFPDIHSYRQWRANRKKLVTS